MPALDPYACNLEAAHRRAQARVCRESRKLLDAIREAMRPDGHMAGTPALCSSVVRTAEALRVEGELAGEGS